MHPQWPHWHQHHSFGPSPCSLQTLRTREVAERGTEIDASATTSEVPATEAARARVCEEPTLRQAIFGSRTGWEVAAAVVGKVLAGGAHCGSMTQAQRAPSAHRPSADVHPFRGAPGDPFPILIFLAHWHTLPDSPQQYLCCCSPCLGQLLGPTASLTGMQTSAAQTVRAGSQRSRGTGHTAASWLGAAVAGTTAASDIRLCRVPVLLLLPLCFSSHTKALLR